MIGRRDLTFLFLGVFLSIVALVVFWQTNKQELAPRLFSAIAVNKSCILDLNEVELTEEQEEIYFVGCGGFF
jgi:hypothetical protein